MPSDGVTPSSVFTLEPLIVSTGTRQDMTASPSSRHVQVPQVPDAAAALGGGQAERVAQRAQQRGAGLGDELLLGRR